MVRCLAWVSQSFGDQRVAGAYLLATVILGAACGSTPSDKERVVIKGVRIDDLQVASTRDSGCHYALASLG